MLPFLCTVQDFRAPIRLPDFRGLQPVETLHALLDTIGDLDRTVFQVQCGSCEELIAEVLAAKSRDAAAPTFAPDGLVAVNFFAPGRISGQTPARRGGEERIRQGGGGRGIYKRGLLHCTLTSL